MNPCGARVRSVVAHAPSKTVKPAKNWGLPTLSQGAPFATRGQSGLSPFFRPLHFTPAVLNGTGTTMRAASPLVFWMRPIAAQIATQTGPLYRAATTGSDLRPVGQVPDLPSCVFSRMAPLSPPAPSSRDHQGAARNRQSVDLRRCAQMLTYVPLYHALNANLPLFIVTSIMIAREMSLRFLSLWKFVRKFHRYPTVILTVRPSQKARLVGRAIQPAAAFQGGFLPNHYLDPNHTLNLSFPLKIPTASPTRSNISLRFINISRSTTNPHRYPTVILTVKPC
jgi:hypothetical protein